MHIIYKPCTLFIYHAHCLYIMLIVYISCLLFIYHACYLYITHIIYISCSLFIYHAHYLYIMHIIYISCTLFIYHEEEIILTQTAPHRVFMSLVTASYGPVQSMKSTAEIEFLLQCLGRVLQTSEDCTVLVWCGLLVRIYCIYSTILWNLDVGMGEIPSRRPLILVWCGTLLYALYSWTKLKRIYMILSTCTARWLNKQWCPMGRQTPRDFLSNNIMWQHS